MSITLYKTLFLKVQIESGDTPSKICLQTFSACLHRYG